MRAWSSSGPDDGSVHCLGNGSLCVYEQGPNLIQVFGPPYSAPAFFKVTVADENSVETVSQRQFGTAIWTHQVSIAGRPAGEITDFVDADLPCLVRRFRLSHQLNFQLRLDQPAKVVLSGDALLSHWAGLMLEVPAGRFFYHVYPFPTVIYNQIAWQGAVQVVPNADGSLWQISIEPGESTLIFCGGPDLPEARTFTDAALTTPYAQLLERTQQAWQNFTREQIDFAARLPGSLPLRSQLLQTIDDVAVLIKSQQSRQGGIIAGYAYHMAYVRDQYGTTRGLLALGHLKEARAVLEFYWRQWQQYAVIHNGQAAGLEGIFHIHENDESELTGYLILQAFDYLNASGDTAFFAELWPMLEWAWKAQVRNLAAGMLPFNGDETYIAGGLLPRSAINDGSAEATLLFLTGGEKLLNCVEAQQHWSTEELSQARQVLEEVKAGYRKNFFKDGRLITNNPARVKTAVLPRFRHGVCEKCHEKKRWYIVWTERSETGRYLCPECSAEGPYPAAEADIYNLPSVSLAPFYHHSSLFAPAELEPAILEIARGLCQNGVLPTHQEGAFIPGSYAVGYDYGFLLNALTVLEHPLAGNLYQATLNLLDSTGCWVEYYQDGRPSGTRCRPWESAINLEAILRWALSPARK